MGAARQPKGAGGRKRRAEEVGTEERAFGSCCPVAS